MFSIISLLIHKAFRFYLSNKCQCSWTVGDDQGEEELQIWSELCENGGTPQELFQTEEIRQKMHVVVCSMESRNTRVFTQGIAGWLLSGIRVKHKQNAVEDDAIYCHGYCGKECLPTVLVTHGMCMRDPLTAFACLLELLEAGREGVSVRLKEKLWKFWGKGYRRSVRENRQE